MLFTMQVLLFNKRIELGDFCHTDFCSPNSIWGKSKLGKTKCNRSFSDVEASISKSSESNSKYDREEKSSSKSKKVVSARFVTVALTNYNKVFCMSRLCFLPNKCFWLAQLVVGDTVICGVPVRASR